MTVYTLAKCWYTVTAAGECSVTATVDGKVLPLATVTGGGQVAFQAVSMQVEVSDEAAIVQLVPKAVVRELSQDYLVYNSTYTEVKGNLDNLTNGYGMFYEKNIARFDIGLPALTRGHSMFMLSGLTFWNQDLPKLEEGAQMFKWCYSLTSFKGDMPLLVSVSNMFARCTALKNFSGDLSSLRDGNQMFASSGLQVFESDVSALTRGYWFICNTGLKVFKSDLSSLDSGGNMFGGAQLNKESALRVLNSIPSYTSGTHALTIGIHVDHKNDEEVAAALTAAAGKGWTVTTQWNGTATAATYSLRRTMALPVYAKMAEMESPDGETEQVLDWCHEVHSPEGLTAEEMGYTLFESLAAAREHYGLPEEEFLTETE